MGVYQSVQRNRDIMNDGKHNKKCSNLRREKE